MVKKPVSYGTASVLALTLLCAAPGASVALAQDRDSSAAAPADAKQGEINHDVQLYLLAASNEPGGGAVVPQSMEGVIRQLRASLPFAHYRVAATFINRVRDGGSFEVSGVGGPPLAAALPNPTSPTFFNFRMANVKLSPAGGDQSFVRVAGLRFGLKVPIQTASVAAEGGKGGYPVIQYQDTGISTEVSVREGAPTVIGTLAATRPDESFVLVMTLKRAPAR